MGGGGQQGGVLKEAKKKNLRNANIDERSRARSLLTGHGTLSTSKVGSWRLVVGGGWQLAVGGWWRLAVSGWRLVAVGS